MMLLRERLHGEGWMAVGVCILACLHITSAWTALRTLANQQNDIYTTHETALIRSQVEELQENQQDEESDQKVLDIEGEGPLSDIQMQILQTLLRRYLENGQGSSELMLSNLVSQIEKRVSSSRHEARKHKAHRKNRSSDANRGTQTTPPTTTEDAPTDDFSSDFYPDYCSFIVNVPMLYEGTCTFMGRQPMAIPACDFEGNSTHGDPIMMLWSYDCL